MIDLSIIIVSYNTKEFLRELLNSIYNATEKSRVLCEVIVVDNASTDGSTSVISNFQFLASIRRSGPISNFKMIKNKENLGFSKANNIGLKHAKGRYILFLNPDTIVNKEALEIMVTFMDLHKDVGAATCRVVLSNGKIDDASHRGFPTPWNAFSHFFGFSRIFSRSRIFAGYSLGWEDLSKTHEIDACAGAFMIVRRVSGDQIGWWDEDYFFYGEDLDFCYRLKQNGWKIYYVPTASTLHYKGVSGGIKSLSQDITTASRETKIRATKARFEAMNIFYKKHYMKKYPKIVTWAVMQGINLKRRFSRLAL